ncbi:Phosphatidylserine decarboxylase proenzyme 2 [Hondaea fermentalgiana]|uniref:Phosphatidylserine decarboxylase proenzyme 2 n=1 Tax=Hondaea fermentalgiana TaxID=2315210 RepID=A0A2R5GWS5_9STRA|nr:Phosphatidylserine decarboxylase proenzyme 2 [Hondaea fermentalgiana]|eukprot:GBG32861.1 Phosphatidylserine decarboxylase proenzyme 2 [Hondaea fermentalgiana]
MEASALATDEMEALATRILEGLRKLTALEKQDKEGEASDAKAQAQAELIPLLEKAILRSPDDQTMRIVYRRIYGDGDDAFETGDPSFDRFEMMRASLVALSVEFGKAWTRPESAALIPRFIETYEVDTSLCVKPLEAFTSMNDFFYRAIDLEAHRPLSPDPNADGARVISAMADAHYMLFRPWEMVRGLVVKNKVFNMHDFLGGDETGFAADMEGGDVICVRLHPRHIHRAYAPLDATIGRIWHGGIAYHTTKPIGIEHPFIDTLGENKRVVVELVTSWGSFLVAFVGGPLIGSVQLQVQQGTHVERGQEIALFAYGGSAIYMCFPRSFPRIDFTIPSNLPLTQAAELQLRSTLGSLAQPSVSSTSSATSFSS